MHVADIQSGHAQLQALVDLCHVYGLAVVSCRKACDEVRFREDCTDPKEVAERRRAEEVSRLVIPGIKSLGWPEGP